MLELVSEPEYFVPLLPYFINLQETVVDYTIEQTTMETDLIIQLPEAAVQCGD